MRLPAHVAARLGNEACLVPHGRSTWPAAAPSPRQNCSVCGQAPKRREFHAAAVVGSIIFFTSVIFVAGKPLTSACLRMMASSLAR